MKRTGAQIVCESLLKEGVDTLFGYPGGAVIQLYDTLIDYPLRHILVRHEQAAVHAADGYARATGDVGVCLFSEGGRMKVPEVKSWQMAASNPW